ncbi:MAG TPA: 3-hydroxyacyl-CoA dehydrogenase NAD-binding domain-containing protein, partial [Thermoanaerobaculia bacterium]
MTNQIATIAVLGAGTMGRGIAHVAAQAGYQTHLYDTSAEALKKAEASIHKNLAKGVELKKVDPQVAERAQQSLGLYDNLLDAVERADLVVESVPESIHLKIET